LKSSSTSRFTSDLNFVSLEELKKNTSKDEKKHRLVKVKTKPTRRAAMAPVKSNELFFKARRTIKEQAPKAKPARAIK
jgi:hypothetical protein